MAKVSVRKMLNKIFFIYFLVFSFSKQETNIFQNKMLNSNFRRNDYVNSTISVKRKIENIDNIITVIAKGKKDEEIKILDNNFKYPPSKVYINDLKENLGRVTKVNLTQDGDNEITIIWDNAIQDCYRMFHDCQSLISIDMSKFDSSLITSMVSMFYGCSNLTFINLTNFNTSSVTNMSSVFDFCEKLNNLDVSKFNTSSTKSFNRMFYACHSLTSLDVSKFDTSSATMMDEMFYYCYSLTSLDVSNFNTTLAKSLSGMFYNCYSLTSLEVSNFDTSTVTRMDWMFGDCHSIKSLDVSKFNTISTQRYDGMFYTLYNLTSLDVSKFNTSSATVMNHMFDRCYSLTSLDVSKFNTSLNQGFYRTFSSCYSLAYLDVSKFDTSSVTIMDYMFYNSYNLISLDVSNFNTTSTKSFTAMFCNCYTLTYLDVSKFDTSSATMMNYMFFNCYSLIYLDILNFNITLNKDFNRTFYNCYSLTSIDLSYFNSSSLTNMEYMFYNCRELRYLNLSSFYTKNVENMNYLFARCENLKYIDFPNLDTIKVRNNFINIFIDCYSLEYMNIENYNGKDIFDSIPYNNNLTICLKDENIPDSLIQIKAYNNCLNSFYRDISSTNIQIDIHDQSSSHKNSFGLIIGIVFGGIAFITGIIITIIFIRKKPPKPPNLNPNPEVVLNILKKNKELADNLLKELKIEIYSKNKNKDYPKCIICYKDFYDNLSRIITTNCGHIFHKSCFQNHLYTNLICPKCPICNNFLLESNTGINRDNINHHTISENNQDQTNIINLIGYKNLIN